ncbi:MAG: hypothetical protein LUD74_08985 [Tannerellaceae bacterium]|nr:hypothetical protein [Tannerellaceae bacterium]
MSKREALERAVAIARERIDNAPADTPQDVLDTWRTEYDMLSFDLNNLYDYNDMEQPE